MRTEVFESDHFRGALKAFKEKKSQKSEVRSQKENDPSGS
jgi:hypothetical protein